MTGHPAISVPAGVMPEGVPVRSADHRAAVPRRHGALGRRGVGADEPVAARRARLRTVLALGTRGCSRGAGGAWRRSRSAGSGRSPSSSASSLRRIAVLATSAPGERTGSRREAQRLQVDERQVEDGVGLPEDPVRHDPAAEVRGSDPVARVAVSVVDVAASDRPERRQVVSGDVDRATPGGLERHVDEAGEHPVEVRDRGRGSPRGS